MANLKGHKMAKTKAVAKVEEKKNTSLAVSQELPDYLTGRENMGTEALGKGDFKIPRIKLLQSNSPEVRSFQGKALPSQFWHTGANKDLGSEFLFVPAIVSKRVIVWRPRDDNDGGILAFSRDGVKWDSGANQEFSVKLKNIKNPVKWRTGKNVQDSGLLDFGTSNPDEPQSAPAATLAYEYMAFLLAHPEDSPTILGVMKTGVGNARQLNTYLLSQRKPTSCMVIRCFSDEEQGNGNTWFVPKFEPAGYASKEVFQIAENIKEKYQDYVADIDLDEETTSKPIDEVAY